jgi:hypothetical protein
MQPSLRPSLRLGVIAVTLVGCLAAAQGFLLSRAPAAADGGEIMDETTGSLGAVDTRDGGAALSDEQRFRIYEGVMEIPGVPVVRAPAPDVADRLADGVPLRDLPAEVKRAIPQVASDQFAKFDDRIVVVDPASRIVVAMIPRYRVLP